MSLLRVRALLLVVAVLICYPSVTGASQPLSPPKRTLPLSGGDAADGHELEARRLKSGDGGGSPPQASALTSGPADAATSTETARPKAAYVVILVDLFGGGGVWLSSLLQVPVLRKFARDAGVPDDHIITISRCSMQWVKAVLNPTAGVDPSTLPGTPNPQHGQVVQRVQAVEAEEYRAMFEEFSIPLSSAAAWREELSAAYKSWEEIRQPPFFVPPPVRPIPIEELQAAFKQKGMDLFEEFDYYGEDKLTSHTLRGILNGECPLQQQQQPGRPCKVIPKPTRDGETYSVFVWLTLHGSDPFGGPLAGAAAGRNRVVGDLDPFGILPLGLRTKAAQLVDIPVTGDQSAMIFNHQDFLKGKQVQALFTTDITNPAVRNGDRVVVLNSCYGGSLVEHAFEKLTRKTAAEEGSRVSTLLDPTRKKTYVGPTSDKVLFLTYQDRYSVYIREELRLALEFLTRDRSSATFGSLVTEMRSRRRNADGDSHENVGPVLEFLRQHAPRLRAALANKDSKPEAFEQERERLKQQLNRFNWRKISATKRISIAATLSGLAGDSRVRYWEQVNPLVSKLGAWGNRQLFDTTIADFLSRK